MVEFVTMNDSSTKMLKPSDVFQPPDDETLQKMRLDLNEDPQRLQRQIDLFKEWLKCENYLPKNVDQHLILNFIRYCKCDLDKAKKKFVHYLMVRGKLKSYYDNTNIGTYFDEVALHRQIVMCPKLTPEGYRIGCTRLPEDINQFDFIKTFHFFLIFLDFALHEDTCGGYVGIYDFENLSHRHLAKINFNLLAEALDIVYNVAPFIVKAVHLVNVPSIPDTLACLLKKVVPQRIVDRAYVHKDISSLKQYLSPEVIPKEYGGDNFTCGEASDILKSFFVENREWEKKLVDLKLIGCVPDHKGGIYSLGDFEMGGSFRKLTID